MENKNKFWSVRTMVCLAILVAMDVVLSRFLSISLWNTKIGFAFVPMIISAKMFGIKGAAIQGALGDFVGAVLFPIGTYFPGFTITAALNGILFGYFLKNPNKKNIVLLVVISEILCTVLINSLWISLLYGSPFVGLLGVRGFQALICGVMKIVLIPLVLEVVKSLDKELA